MGKKLLIGIIISFLLIFSFGCKKNTETPTYTVSGYIEGVSEFSDLSICVNGIPINLAIGSDGSFKISSLKSGDIISVDKYGYDFTTYKVKGTIDGIRLAGTLKTYNINVSFDEREGSVAYQESATFGSEVTLTATPKEHYQFVGYYLDETLICDKTIYTFTAQDDVTYSARFTKILYEIDFTKNHEGSFATISRMSAGIGDTITLTAEDNQYYVFVKWVVNGTEITDKVYEYTLDTTTPVIIAQFIERINYPDIVANEYVITVGDIADCDKFILSINDVVIAEYTSGFSVDLDTLDMLTGDKKIAVTACADGLGDATSEITISYIRPIDTPKSISFSYDEDKTYLVFSRVLGASGYDIVINNTLHSLSEFDYTTDNVITVDVTDVFDASGDYHFGVIAKGSRCSNPREITYTYFGALTSPIATLVGSELTWSHENKNVTFTIAVNGVAVLNNVDEGTQDIGEYLYSGETLDSVTIIASLDNYKSSSKTIEIN